MKTLGMGEMPATGTVVAVGVFDGVHLGHQELFREAARVKEKTGLPLLVLTFSPHPRTLTGSPNGYQRMLTPPYEKALTIEDMGADYLLVMPFTRELASTPPKDFAKEHLAMRCRAKHVVCGFNFAFGHKGSGTPADLENWGRELGFSVSVVPSFSLEGSTVSSTRIRNALSAGDVAEVAACLGRPYSLTGRVAHGDGRGKRIGLPTSNIPIAGDKMIPANGVYVAWARVMVEDVSGHTPKGHPAVVNIGLRPTFGGEGVTAEVHIPGFSGELYGRNLQVLFVQRLRDERKFDGAAALLAQVAKDIGVAEAALRAAPSFTLPKAYDRMLALDLP